MAEERKVHTEGEGPSKIEGMTVLSGDVDVNDLPHESTPTDASGVDADVRVLTQEQVTEIIGKSRRRRIEREISDLRDPDDAMEEAVNSKVRDVAELIKNVKEQLRSVVYSNEPVLVKFEFDNEVFTFDTRDENRHQLLAMFLFESQINYPRFVTIYYVKNDILLRQESKRCSEVMSEYGLSEEIGHMRTKSAACRLIHNQLEQIDGRASAIETLKSEDASVIMEYLDDTILAVNEIEDGYCHELYQEVAGLHEQLEQRTESVDDFKRQTTFAVPMETVFTRG